MRGDIVKENWHKYIISFNRGCYNITDVETQKCYTISACCCEKSEVIGNIYENKELLDEMNEIEKLYKNAGVEDKNINNQLYKDLNYPQFTAEKQLELIKWLGIRDEFNFYQNKITKDWIFYDHEKDATHYNFKLGLASWVNYLWQDLTSEEKEQVRGILNERN